MSGRAGTQPSMEPAQPDGRARARADRRTEVLVAHGASSREAEELLTYGAVASERAEVPVEVGFPLADEGGVAAWQSYAERSREVGVLASLRRALVQLHFPVRTGISQEDVYLAATRRGIVPSGDGSGLELTEPEGLRLLIHPTPAGRIPVLVTSARRDFVALMQALTARNEPQPIPHSVGACIVGGYNNWSRVRAVRRRWEAGGFGLGQTFAEILARKDLFQDRFILLSSGPYSGVQAQTLGLAPKPWLELSLTIRLEHECAHYFTRRVLGSMRNTLHDEILADYVGITAALGRFRADWFLRFLGLERPARVRPDGRLQSYRGEPPLSDGALAVLASLVRTAARNLEQIDAAPFVLSAPLERRGAALLALARLTLEDLASADGVDLLRSAVATTEPRSSAGGG